MTVIRAKIENWIAESTNTVGTGDVLLNGALLGFAPFSVFNDGDKVYYTIQEGENKETGIGTLSGRTLERTTVYATIVNGVFSTGTPLDLIGVGEVYCTITADLMRSLDQIANSVPWDNGKFPSIPDDNVQDIIDLILDFQSKVPSKYVSKNNNETAAIIPQGDKAPGSVGEFRWNQTKQRFEGHNGTVWGQIGGSMVEFKDISGDQAVDVGFGYRVDTSTTPTTLALPANPEEFSWLLIQDATGNASKNPISIDNIYQIDIDRAGIQLTWFDSKWNITGGYGLSNSLSYLKEQEVFVGKKDRTTFAMTSGAAVPADLNEVLLNGTDLVEGTDYDIVNGAVVLVDKLLRDSDTIKVRIYRDSNVADLDVALSKKPNDNLLINGDFSVCQRSAKSSGKTNYGFTADRWRLAGSVDLDWIMYPPSHKSVMDATYLRGGFLSLAVPASATYAYVQQNIENGEIEVRNPSGKVTFSWLIASTSHVIDDFKKLSIQTVAGDGTVTLLNEHPTVNIREGTSACECSATFDLEKSPKNPSVHLGFRINFPAGFNGWIAEAKVEHGPISTSFVVGDPATNLVKCQRYYQEVKVVGNNYKGMVKRGSSISLLPTKTVTVIGDIISFSGMREVPTATYVAGAGSNYWVIPGVVPLSIADTGTVEVTCDWNTFSVITSNITSVHDIYEWVASAGQHPAVVYEGAIWIWEPTFSVILDAEL